MDRQQLQDQVSQIDFWYHRIELPGGVVTPGLNPVHAPAYRIPEDLRGKRVLDVGAWDGYWTFEALRRGASQVVAIDDFSDFLGKLRPEQRHAWKSFDLCRQALGYTEAQCQRHEISLYEITEEVLGGRFDIVFCFGTLYHLRHPLLGLDKLSSVCDGTIFVESQICDDYSPYRGQIGQGYPGHQMIAEFYPTDELAGNDSNWWAPTLYCLCGFLYAAGFTHNLQGWKLTDNPQQIGHCRGFAMGSKP